jgi:hypothetical protein
MFNHSGFLVVVGAVISILLTPNLLIARVDDARLRFLEKAIDQNTSKLFIINNDENMLRDPSEVLKLTRLSDIKGLQRAECSETSNQNGAVLCILTVNTPCGFVGSKLAVATTDNQIAVIEQFSFRSSGIHLATNVTGFSNMIGCSMDWPK